jgi:hypothetical protein
VSEEKVVAVFPPTLYPAIAPLSAPMANHLLLQEERQNRQRPSRRPPPEMMVEAVLERIRRVRPVVFDYLHPFVIADTIRQREGKSRAFPRSDFLRETLAQYSPGQGEISEATLDYWQRRGLLRREQPRGLLDITSVAALLIARLVEGNRQRNWLPSEHKETEPFWWCFGRVAPDAPIQAIPVPIPAAFPASLVVWTPWRGVMWEDGWQGMSRRGEYFYWWARPPSAQDLLVWDEEISRKLLAVQHDPLFGRPSVQTVLLQEAMHDVLAYIVQEGLCHVK